MQCNVMERPSLWAAQGSETARRATHPGSLRPCWFHSKEHRPSRYGRWLRKDGVQKHGAAGGRGGRVSPIHDDDSTRRPIIIIIIAVVARWRGGTVAHHARLAARLERRVLPIHLAILGALAAKLLEVVASEMTAAVRRRGAEREKNKRIRCRASHPVAPK